VNVYIRQSNVSDPEARGGPHLFTTAGYLDPNWFNRTLWHYGQAQTSGLMVGGKDLVYGMELYDSRSRETVFRPGSSAYRLVCRPTVRFAVQTQSEPTPQPKDEKKRLKAKKGEAGAAWKRISPSV